jgi:uncharacterized protein with GYD domain
MRIYWILVRFDGVAIKEALTEKDAMKTLLCFQDVVETEMLVAIPRKESNKLL